MSDQPRRQAGLLHQLALLDMGTIAVLSPDGVPGAEVMANASPAALIELATDYWVSFLTDSGRTESGLRPTLLNRIFICLCRSV